MEKELSGTLHKRLSLKKIKFRCRNFMQLITIHIKLRFYNKYISQIAILSHISVVFYWKVYRNSALENALE